jgi:hypothetical protein
MIDSLRLELGWFDGKGSRIKGRSLVRMGMRKEL